MREPLQTARLLLRRPVASDAPAIFERYASDPDVTRYLAWRRHQALDQTEAFVDLSDAEWARWPVGPLLICLRDGGALIGGTGLSFETQHRAATGYVLAKDQWGKGYATEALAAIVELAGSVGIQRLYATCHVDHRASARVMEKCGFEREALMRRHSMFPNLTSEPADVLQYARILNS